MLLDKLRWSYVNLPHPPTRLLQHADATTHISCFGPILFTICGYTDQTTTQGPLLLASDCQPAFATLAIAAAAASFDEDPRVSMKLVLVRCDNNEGRTNTLGCTWKSLTLSVTFTSSGGLWWQVVRSISYVLQGFSFLDRIN